MSKGSVGIWVLALVSAFLAGACVYPLVWGLVSMSHNWLSTPMYVGRTTLTEYVPPQYRGRYDKTEFGNLGAFATSQAVISNTVQTLSNLGMSKTPEEILSATSIIPVKDTSIIAVEVTLPDAKEAKVAADVFADQMKEAYVSRHAEDVKKGFALRTVDPAYVRRYDPHPGADILAVMVSRCGGPAIGVIVGLLLGLSSAAVYNRRRAASQ